MMLRLLYISTARQVLTSDELDRVLEISRRNNAAVGVTGLLIVGGKRFLQALEGPADAIDTVFSRIANDPRHYAVVQLAREQITTRAFGDWSMGYQPGGTASENADLQTIVATLIAPIDDPRLRGYFTGFAQLHAA